MKARPRNKLIVPMVTTIEGSFSPVTRKPLKAPHNMPTPMPTATSVGVSAPYCSARPINVEASAMIEATDRSISPVMITSAMASAIRPFSVKLKVRSLRLQALRK